MEEECQPLGREAPEAGDWNRNKAAEVILMKEGET